MAARLLAISLEEAGDLGTGGAAQLREGGGVGYGEPSVVEEDAVEAGEEFAGGESPEGVSAGEDIASGDGVQVLLEDGGVVDGGTAIAGSVFF